jgi:hypothetical protein
LLDPELPHAASVTDSRVMATRARDENRAIRLTRHLFGGMKAVFLPPGSEAE